MRYTRRRYVWEDGQLRLLGVDEGGFTPLEPPDHGDLVEMLHIVEVQIRGITHSPDCPVAVQARREAKAAWN